MALSWSEKHPAPSTALASSPPLEESLSCQERDWTSSLLHYNSCGHRLIIYVAANQQHAGYTCIQNYMTTAL